MSCCTRNPIAALGGNEQYWQLQLCAEVSHCPHKFRTGQLQHEFHSRSASQFVEQRLRVLQIRRIKPLGEPLVHRGQQVIGVLALVLGLPQASEAGGGFRFMCRGRRACLYGGVNFRGTSRLDEVAHDLTHLVCRRVQRCMSFAFEGIELGAGNMLRQIVAN